MGISIDVNRDNFETEVLARSHQHPVLIDFFAQWCGPCQMLKPMLEKLVNEYDFTLAKVDIDQNPELANAYHVEGVPDVRVVIQGEVKPGFVGVLAEPQLRNLLSQYGLQSSLELELQKAQAARVAGDLDEAKRIFGQLIEQHPNSPDLAIAAAEFLISIDRLDSALKLIDSIPASSREYYGRAQALKTLIQFKQEVETLPSETELDQTYRKAAQLTIQGQYDTALPLLLEIVERDRKYRNDAARKTMLMIFSLLGDDHALTKNYRKQLTRALY